ncbi:MAG: sensor histidine kinase [Frankiales bacterium]|nr:sensor histidine kinase [Frankiales bacterium]
MTCVNDQSAGEPPTDPYGNPVRSRRARVMEIIFPGVFLIYLAQTANGVVKHTDGWLTMLGMIVVGAYCVIYIYAAHSGGHQRYGRFWQCYWVLVALLVIELPLAHEDALVMLVYLAVLTVASMYTRSAPVVAVMVLVAALLPKAIPSWHVGVQWGTALAVGIVALAMHGFFGIMRSKQAVEAARGEVVRLAAENERSRIARDLHDLLGHSLTTITVKAALANRLTAIDPARAAAEIAEVEELTRRTLADVRAAVSGYRDVSLGNELATAREVLRAAGITAQLPGAIDNVETAQSQLFAWVVREGVTNVVRHSRAQTCEVRLGDRFVEIVDDGMGIGGDSAGNGLRGLRERVESVGGSLSAGVRTDRRGWQLRVEAPVA